MTNSAEYRREWQRKNREKCRVYAARWAAKNRGKVLSARRARYIETRPFLRPYRAIPHSAWPVPDEELYVPEPNTGCWLWLRGVNGGGYGVVSHRARGTAQAHRYFYTKYAGAIRPGMTLDHLCRVPSCVNPQHLEQVTQAENTRRGLATRLTADQVVEIRRLYFGKEGTMTEIGRAFGVSLSNVSRIVNGSRWVAT